MISPTQQILQLQKENTALYEEKEALQKRIEAITDAMKGTVPVKVEQFKELTAQAVKLQKAQERLTAVYHILVMLNKERKDNTVTELLQALRQPL